MRKLLLLALIATTISVWAEVPGCGDKEVMDTVIEMIQEEYFEPERELKLKNVRAIGRDRDLDMWTCTAVLDFERKGADYVYRRGPVDNAIDVRYEVSPNAAEPDKTIISVDGIWELELDF